jgi:hypothetical protein
MSAGHVLSWAGVIVALAFFVLIAYVVTVLHASPKLAAIIAAVATLAGALPAILLALNAVRLWRTGLLAGHRPQAMPVAAMP